MKILYKYIILGLMLIFVNSINASIILNWSATTGETKTIYAISGSYTIDWGDGNQSQESSHT